MPPKTEEDAELFLQCLGDMVTAWTSPAGREEIRQSVETNSVADDEFAIGESRSFCPCHAEGVVWSFLSWINSDNDSNFDTTVGKLREFYHPPYTFWPDTW
jgi:hypothetical protein